MNSFLMMHLHVYQDIYGCLFLSLYWWYIDRSGFEIFEPISDVKLHWGEDGLHSSTQSSKINKPQGFWHHIFCITDDLFLWGGKSSMFSSLSLFGFLGYKGRLVLDFCSHLSLKTTHCNVHCGHLLWKGCEILHEKGTFFTYKRNEAINLTKGPSI